MVRGSSIFATASACRRRLRAWRGDRRGAAALEFALVAAPFVALLIASLEMSLAFFAQEALETAAEVAGRSIMTGGAQTGGAGGTAQTAAQFKTATCAQLPSFMSCDKLLIDVRPYSDFTSVDTSKPTITYDGAGNITNNFSGNGFGNATDIVVLRLMYLWPISSGPLGFNLQNAGGNQHLLMATSVAQTEGYSS